MALLEKEHADEGDHGNHYDIEGNRENGSQNDIAENAKSEFLRNGQRHNPSFQSAIVAQNKNQE